MSFDARGNQAGDITIVQLRAHKKKYLLQEEHHKNISKINMGLDRGLLVWCLVRFNKDIMVSYKGFPPFYVI